VASPLMTARRPGRRLAFAPWSRSAYSRSRAWHWQGLRAARGKHPWRLVLLPAGRTGPMPSWSGNRSSMSRDFRSCGAALRTVARGGREGALTPCLRTLVRPGGYLTGVGGRCRRRQAGCRAPSPDSAARRTSRARGAQRPRYPGRPTRDIRRSRATTSMPE